jgi:hypothetical protein
MMLGLAACVESTGKRATSATAAERNVSPFGGDILGGHETRPGKATPCTAAVLFGIVVQD